MLPIGDREFVSIPGEQSHDLPPLLVRVVPEIPNADSVFGQAADIVDSEELLAPIAIYPLGEQELERRRADLAFTLIDQYKAFLTQWLWGDSVLEWIRQCEITFDQRPVLRPLFANDIWPRAGRSSFVTLIEDKHVPHQGIALDRAVGMRLTFRQPPPINCFSEQFLFYLNGSVAESAYRTWTSMSTHPAASLPPERFNFEFHVM